jgi:hypothetical protein
MINSIAIRLNVAPKDGNFSFDISELEAMLPAGTMDNNVEMVYKEVPYINLIFILIFHINFIIVNFLEANEIEELWVHKPSPNPLGAHLCFLCLSMRGAATQAILFGA